MTFVDRNCLIKETFKKRLTLDGIGFMVLSSNNANFALAVSQSFRNKTTLRFTRLSMDFKLETSTEGMMTKQIRSLFLISETRTMKKLTYVIV